MVDVLLITPPFFFYNTPHTGLSLLKAVLNKNCITSEVLYCNLEYRKRISPELYDRISLSLGTDLVSEYIFAAAAFPAVHPEQKIFAEKIRKTSFMLPGMENYLTITELSGACAQVTGFLEQTAAVILEKHPVIVGFNSSYNQLCACMAMADYLKKKQPALVTAIGGYNCLQPMATALSSLTNSLDYIFTGEGEYVFLNFCREILEGRKPASRVIPCTPVADLDALPYPDFTDYFAASRIYSINPAEIILAPEGSRGCAWGDHSRCLFCGAAGEANPYRKKSFLHFKEEINQITNLYQCSRIFPVDMAIAPDFITGLAGSTDCLGITDGYYEARPDLNYDALCTLKASRFYTLQSGIETFHDKLLEILKKGTTCLGNIRFLRDCLHLGISVNWVFIHTIPGESEEDYREILEILPSLFHLQPPVLITSLILQRYSPLYRQHAAYGIKTLNACPAYYDIFPGYTDFDNLAVCFESAHAEAVDPASAKAAVIAMIKEWQLIWHTFTPRLSLLPADHGCLLIKDTREIRKDKKSADEPAHRLLTEKHRGLLEKALTPVPETEFRETACASSRELEELLSWKCIVKHSGNLLALLVPPF